MLVSLTRKTITYKLGLKILLDVLFCKPRLAICYTINAQVVNTMNIPYQPFFAKYARTTPRNAPKRLSSVNRRSKK